MAFKLIDVKDELLFIFGSKHKTPHKATKCTKQYDDTFDTLTPVYSSVKKPYLLPFDTFQSESQRNRLWNIVMAGFVFKDFNMQ